MQLASIRVPKRAAIMVGTSAPPVFKAVPPMISGATKLKLVPGWRAVRSRPGPRL
ncbi:hypothetical protein KPZU09_53930 [Klebsiella pneumoniae]|uniref:Uncharacterized protein n=1 Tax=Klebsiella pneumoniae TaxID=573 RepID=A0A919HXM3_KLEPN|nr:hypothetical protein KPZU09_53930 [Klebsiella pneumoniae]